MKLAPIAALLASAVSASAAVSPVALGYGAPDDLPVPPDAECCDPAVGPGGCPDENGSFDNCWDEGGYCCADGSWYAHESDGSGSCSDKGLADSQACAEASTLPAPTGTGDAKCCDPAAGPGGCSDEDGGFDDCWDEGGYCCSNGRWYAHAPDGGGSCADKGLAESKACAGASTLPAPADEWASGSADASTLPAPADEWASGSADDPCLSTWSLVVKCIINHFGVDARPNLKCMADCERGEAGDADTCAEGCATVDDCRADCLGGDTCKEEIYEVMRCYECDCANQASTLPAPAGTTSSGDGGGSGGASTLPNPVGTSSSGDGDDSGEASTLPAPMGTSSSGDGDKSDEISPPSMRFAPDAPIATKKNLRG